MSSHHTSNPVLACSSPTAWPGGAGGLHAGGRTVLELQQLQDSLQQQLQQLHGHNFSTDQPMSAASTHMLHLMKTGVSCAEAETLRFLGFGVLQFTAALQAYWVQHEKKRESVQWPVQLQELQRLGWLGNNDTCSTSMSSSSVFDTDDCCSTSSSSSSSSERSAARRGNVVQEMSKYASELTTVRHR